MDRTDKNNTHSLDSRKLILVLDDDSDVLNIISFTLKKAGFKVKITHKSGLFWEYMLEKTPDLILLDLMLLDDDGFEICRKLKVDERYSSIPVIFLSSISDESTKVDGLKLGALDYITKPVHPHELIARVNKVIEEYYTPSQKLVFGKILEIDLIEHEVFVNHLRIDLTATEFKILKLLTERKDWCYARDQILERLGSEDKGIDSKTINVHVKNLREKLGPAGSFIKNIRGIGYKLEE